MRDKSVYLFLDYDGTLAPIAKTPDKAVMPKEAKDLLRILSKSPNIKIAIISGRALKDISKRAGLKNIIYVGNHGFEIKGPGINFKRPLPLRCRKALDEIKDRLRENLSPFKGVFIEDKGASLSAHYRLANKKDTPSIKDAFYKAAFPYAIKHCIKISAGKMVFEAKPDMGWDKGKMVLWLLARQKFIIRSKGNKVLPVYIGDDTTDEDAFAALKSIGITVFVGKPGKSEASFYLKGIKEVLRFLRAMFDEKSLKK